MMNTRSKRITKLLALSDVALALMYSEFSEKWHAVSWKLDHEEEFVKMFLNGWFHPVEPLTSYKRASVANIRKLLEERCSNVSQT